MVDILHKVGIKSPAPSEVYKALTSMDGLSGWWTTDTTGHSKIGEKIHFQFGERGFFDMKVLELEPGSKVLWQVVDGPAEWIGTRISFDLRQEGDYTVVMFKHQGWKEVVDFMHHCSTKWAIFLMSLKSLVETSKGQPFPNDVLIEDGY
jgi:hypothetical protein